MRDKRDRQKKRCIEALILQGTVYHAAKAAGVSRQTVYRWREEDPEFAQLWEEAIENDVDEVESTDLSPSRWRQHARGDLLPQGPPSDLSR